MKKLMLLCLTGVIATAISSVAGAEDSDAGYYGNLGAGYVAIERPSFADTMLPVSDTRAADNSIDFTGSLGYLYDSGLRTEFEVSFRLSGVDDGSVDLGVTTLPDNTTGDLRALGGMLNMLYDFDTRVRRSCPISAAGSA